MILESAQILCTVHHYYGNGDNVPYKKTHLNHPSTVWARKGIPNYTWLYRHMIALGDEYTKRYGKVHMSIGKCAEALRHPPKGIDTYESFTQPPQCMPDEYKDKCSVKAYWNYYLGDKHSGANSNETIKTKIYE